MKPQLFRIVTFCNFLMLTWTGLLHFTSGISYNPLFETGENMTLVFGFFLMVVGLISLFPLNYLRTGGLKSLYLISTLMLILHAINDMIATNNSIEILLLHSMEVLLPFSVFLHLNNEGKKRNWKEIFYFGLFFTLVGQSISLIGLRRNEGLGYWFQSNFHFSENWTNALAIGIGALTIIFTLLLFIAQTRVLSFWYITLYCVIFGLSILGIRSMESEMMTFFTVDLSMLLAKAPLMVLPLYFLARTYQWKWVLPIKLTPYNFN